VISIDDYYVYIVDFIDNWMVKVLIAGSVRSQFNELFNKIN